MKIRDVMNSEPVAIQATEAVSDAVRLLRTNEISGMPVLEGDRLAGVVSESDLLRMLSVEREGGLWLPSPLEVLEVPIRDLIRWEKLQAGAEEAGMTRVSEVMTKKVFTVSPEDSIERAASMMVRHRINRLPVLEEGKLVGIVTRGDIIAGLGMEAEEVEED
ncbi:CBS domain-containing protein [Methanothrix harundinacea]|jgi:CBS domain-containing protein|uniref:Putative signal transduction protein with CBS domains n=1 Tax=Methanothrix harundinacea (strain 6Ac) TaxID=1110509 RepID=G7WPW4_METH6|nr:CBS domain-containing protein [Methanothrix harundinacea]AET64995.1 Putative signal transduction protein with CBS domains [Methanothrix harundinacea 6Ac]